MIRDLTLRSPWLACWVDSNMLDKMKADGIDAQGIFDYYIATCVRRYTLTSAGKRIRTATNRSCETSLPTLSRACALCRLPRNIFG
jgi:hypothetical protein